eukprot:2243498-Pyramimonas_sp.AAC.1
MRTPPGRALSGMSPRQLRGPRSASTKTFGGFAAPRRPSSISFMSCRQNHSPPTRCLPHPGWRIRPHPRGPLDAGRREL